MKTPIIKDIRSLIRRYSSAELAQCIDQQIEESRNDCQCGNDALVVMNTLARAQMVRQLMDGGMQSSDAIRELGRRMRMLNQF